MICVPVQARSLSELKQKIHTIPPEVDLIEIWIDHLPEDVKSHEVVNLVPKPLIIANKPKREKGLWKGSERDRVGRLQQFALPGVKYLDIGIDTGPKLIKELVANKKRSKIIISYHNFERTPSAKILSQKVKKGFALGADVVKIATYARTPEDNLNVLSLLKEKKPLAVMCMGKHGKISRVVGPALGSQFAFVAMSEKEKSAPGQLTLKEFLRLTSILP